MCFFIYSPTNLISILYASETTTLFERSCGQGKHFQYAGSSEIIIDLFLQNDGVRNSEDIAPDYGPTPDASLRDIYLLYPNSFLDKRTDGKMTSIATIQDCTYELIDEDNPNNQAYFLPGNDLKVTPISDDNQDDWSITIRQPHPMKLTSQRIDGSFKGRWKNKQNFKTFDISIASDVFDTLQEWEILNKAKICLLKLTSIVPIEVNERRFVRLLIKPFTTSRDSNNFFHRWINYLVKGSISYSYEIIGPYNVEYKARNTIQSIIYQTEDSKRRHKRRFHELFSTLYKSNPIKPQSYEKEHEAVFEEYAIKCELLLGKIKKHIQNIKCTKIEDWRINVNPGKFKTLENIQEYGCAKICGTNKNYIRYDNDTVYLDPSSYTPNDTILYQWKAGKTNICYLNEALPSICEIFKYFISNTDKKQDKDEKKMCFGEQSLFCYPFVGNFRIVFKCERVFTIWRCIIYLSIIYSIWSLIGFIYSLFPHNS